MPTRGTRNDWRGRTHRLASLRACPPRPHPRQPIHQKLRILLLLLLLLLLPVRLDGGHLHALWFSLGELLLLPAAVKGARAR